MINYNILAKRISVLIALFFAVNSIMAQDYYTNRIIVKFKKNSGLASNWIEQGRYGNIEQFDYILGDNIATPFIDDKLLNLLEFRKSNKFAKSANSDIGPNLELIARIDYSNSIDPLFASRKIAAYNDIEYAEIETIKYLFDIMPNDSLLSEQYYLNQVKAVEAWNLIDTTKKVIIAVVDTGVEYDHIDLFDNIYYNSGEIGLDENGNDKRFNGIDDDGNGFIDDWRGWDFFGAGDNDASPGHLHGTHVAGICGAMINNSIGIAGTAPNVKIMAVKTAFDSQFATSIVNGYQGILYAAAMGADVINCSWGSTGYSESELDVIKTSLSLGSTIIAAAGNDNRNQVHYPASYNGVVSVAAVDSTDRAAWFTTYHSTVDVSAPGVGILSTVPISSYQSANGTSMAAPIAAAIAAMIRGKFPNKSNIQIPEILKVTSDNIDSLNPFYEGRIGKGRVNALNAVNFQNANSIIIKSYSISEEIEDLAYLRNETLNINITLQNILDESKNVYVRINEIGSDAFEVIKDSIFYGDITELMTTHTNESFIVKVRDNVTLDFATELIFEINADGGFQTTQTIGIILAPSYKTMTGNSIKATFNSGGNIGFNDYPNNQQGVGFIFEDKQNILFEGALMIAAHDTMVFNAARSTNQMRKENHFFSNFSFEIANPGFVSSQDGRSEFEVKYDPFISPTFSVSQKVYQFNSNRLKNVIFPIYTLYNTHSIRQDSIFLGLYFDWDIHTPQRNKIWWDTVNHIAFAKNFDTDTTPQASVILISDLRENFFAIDNNGNTPENPGVYDGFTTAEKRMMLSSGIARVQSAITDASMVFAGGPFSILPSDSVSVAFAIISGYDEIEIIETAREARKLAVEKRLGANRGDKIFSRNAIANIFPIPANDLINIKLSVVSDDNFDLIIYNSQGIRIKNLFTNNDLKYGSHYFQFHTSDLAIGAYYLILEDSKGVQTKSFIIQRVK